MQHGPGRQGYQGRPDVKPRIRRGSTIDKIFPKLEKRAIELLNTGLAPIDVSRQLEQEGIIKPTTFKRVPRPGRGDRGVLQKQYKPFHEFYKKLLNTGKLKVKEFPKTIMGTLKPQEEIIKLDNIVAKTFNKNPNLSAIRIAKLVSTQTGQKVGPEMVETALKRSGIDYIGKDRKILPEIEKLDKLVKSNARFLSGKSLLKEKRKFLFDAFKKAIGDKTYDTHAFGYRLDRLGQLYAGTGKDRTVDKIYKNIKPPKNYLDSNLQKNVMGMLQHQTRGIIGTAELLGLPPKDIDLLYEIQRGARELAEGITIHGDHTDIDALMKNFPEYRKNFMRINYIKASLNNLKSRTDQAIVTLFKEAQDLGQDKSSQSIRRRGEISQEIKNLRNAFTEKTGLKIGGFKLDKTGKPSMQFTTERISDIDSPRWTKLKDLSGHLGQKPTNVVDQLIMKGKNIKEVLTKYSGSDAIANSQFIKSFSKMGGKWGKLTKALIGGTIGAGGIATLATAGTTREKGLTTKEMKGRKSEMSMVPEVITKNPWTSAGVATAATAATKPGRSLLGKAFRTLGTPIAGPAFAAWNISDKMKAGSSLTDAIIDPLTGVELALPTMFKENVGKITKNPMLQKALSLGKFGTRFLGPIGWGITAAGLGKEAYKVLKEDKVRRESITPEQRRRAQREYFDKDQPMFAGGGIAGLSGGKRFGPPPESGPVPYGGGLSSQFNRVRKLTG